MDDAKPKTGFITRLRARLNQGDSWLTRDITEFMPGGQIDEEVLEEIETRLIMADVGVETTEKVMVSLNKSLARREKKDQAALQDGLRKTLSDVLQPAERPLVIGAARPFVLLMVGVNGAGKTTTAGKLAKKLQADGLSVMLAAADTFRAAAVEQLQAWGERNNVPVIAQTSGADPAAVVYDAMSAAKARQIDVLIADTAGRLQNQQGLMDELAKVKRVIARHDESAPHETMLVIDGSQGQNALQQARDFHTALTLTGITVTKLDGSAKGGILLAIADQLGLPVRFIGVGEHIDDMQPFEADTFAQALLGDSVSSGGSS
ncbi:MAG: signal recognition particle-docking protein FtsY [Pseudomonadota bacterium]